MSKKYLYASLVYEGQFDALEALCDTLGTQAILGHIVGLCVSPTHASDSETTKPHKHIIIASTKKALSKADKEAMFQIGLMPNNTYIQSVINQAGMERYLCHRGYPTKEQFPSDVEPTCFGEYRLSNDLATTQRILDLIDLYDIYEIYDLVHLDEIQFDEELLAIVSRSAYLIQSVLVSKRKRKQAVHDTITDTLAGIS